jgi:hypothetical protein
MATIDLQYFEVVRIETALTESLNRYKQILADMPPLDRDACGGMYESAIRDYTDILEQTSKLYPEHPRTWAGKP